MGTMNVVFYDGFADNEPAPSDLTWTELTTLLSSFEDPECTLETCLGRDCPAKIRAPSWSPVVIEGRRANANVRSVTACALDLDHLKPGAIDRVLESIKGYAAVIHTTHSHAPGDECFRLVLALSRPVTPAEWPLVRGGIVKAFDLPADEKTADLARIYALPTSRGGVEPFATVLEGEAVSVEEALEVAGVKPAAPPPPKPPAEPLSVDELRSVLSTVRRSKAQGPGRDGDQKTRALEQAQLLGCVLEGKPIAEPGARGSTLLRIMGLLAFHLPADTPWEAVLEVIRPALLATDLDTVGGGESGFDQWAATAREQWERALKARLAQDARREADEARFAALRETFANKTARLAAEDVDDWKELLLLDKNGGVKGCEHNAYTVLSCAPEVRDTLRWNTVTKQVEVVGGPFMNTDANSLDHAAASWMQFVHGFQGNMFAAASALMRVAREKPYDPIAEYLGELVWDGTPRIDTFFERCFGAVLENDLGEDISTYVRTTSRKWLIGLVARALRPGCKNDSVLVLEGAQGVGKSTALEALVGSEFFLDTALTIGDKDTLQAIASAWLVELGELASFRRAETEKVKQFFSSKMDRFRPPYGRVTETSPRRAVFAGTTNDDEYLEDFTGNRRYLPIRVVNPSPAAVLAERDQVFAEAVAAFAAGESWYLEGAAAEQAAEQAEARVKEPPIEDIVARWWFGLEPARRPRFVYTTDFARDVLLVPAERIDRALQSKIARALQNLEFKKVRRRVDGLLRWLYEATEKLLTIPKQKPEARAAGLSLVPQSGDTK